MRTILQFPKIVYVVYCKIERERLESESTVVDAPRKGMMKLALLLEEARTASPTLRIEWRDRIAAFGPRAIEGVQPWLSSPVLAAFAIRVIERAGTAGEAPLAAGVLRSARTTVPPAAAADIDWALRRLRATSQPSRATDASPSGAKPSAPPRSSAVRRQPAPRAAR